MDIFAFVLEDEAKFQDQIYFALRKINPQVKIRFFISLEEFSNWIGLFVKDGLAAIEIAGVRVAQDTEIETISSEKTIRLLVCKSEILGAHSISLLSKTVDLFARKGACTEEEKTSVIVTAFDHEQFDLKPMEVKFINNVIFKPFDALVLEEHLRYALIGRRKPTDENFKSNKLEAQVEMVKDIPCEGFSDLGFVTVSDAEIKTGDVNKYYSDEFASEKIRSVMAKCIKSIARGGDLSGFLCWMEYFALDDGQVKKFRKELFNDYPNQHLSSHVKEFKKNILIIESLGDHDLDSSIKRFLPLTNTYKYLSWEQFQFDASPESSGLLVDKDIPIPFNYSLTLDATGHYILEQEPKSDIENVFGETFANLRKKDFQQLLTDESKKKFMEVFRAHKVDLGKEPVLILDNVGKKFLVRLDQISKTQNAAGLPALELKFSEVTRTEKLSLLSSMSPLPLEMDLVLASEEFMKQIVDGSIFPKAKRMLLVPAQQSDKDKRHWATLVYDIFNVPMDRNYLIKKIYLSFMDANQWGLKHFSDTKKEIQSAQQIQIDEISEAGLAFKYHRAMPVGTFRRFYLWTPNETELRDYHGNCNYFEELKEGKNVSYIHHFVFFGMKDFYLKNIRLWVRENYIQSKSKE